ncbi:uncharacterized protein LOC118433849 [Folsomia candida]|uniref:uncharacterized protein LOC118433849 n=1 Tax=Folsomia candida TaxID=158441 RepID=UPI0016051575|nr:uncharacterized protein LOC118433849 [Folsomia candida]
MFQAQVLQIFKMHIKVGQFLKCIPFEYYDTSGKLLKSESAEQLQFFKFQSIISALYAVTMFVNVFVGPLTLTGRFQGLTFSLIYAIAAVSGWNYRMDIIPAQVINFFLQFEEKVIKELPSQGISFLTKALKIVVVLCEFSVVTVPILEFILLSFAPCIPPFMLSMMSNCTTLQTNASWQIQGMQLVIHLFEAWVGLLTLEGPRFRLYLDHIHRYCVCDLHSELYSGIR